METDPGDDPVADDDPVRAAKRPRHGANGGAPGRSEDAGTSRPKQPEDAEFSPFREVFSLPLEKGRVVSIHRHGGDIDEWNLARLEDPTGLPCQWTIKWRFPDNRDEATTEWTFAAHEEQEDPAQDTAEWRFECDAAWDADIGEYGLPQIDVLRFVQDARLHGVRFALAALPGKPHQFCDAHVGDLHTHSGVATLHSIVRDRDGHVQAPIKYNLTFNYARGIARALTAEERAALNAQAAANPPHTVVPVVNLPPSVGANRNVRRVSCTI